jgi:hypothetical protein
MNGMRRARRVLEGVGRARVCVRLTCGRGGRGRHLSAGRTRRDAAAATRHGASLLGLETQGAPAQRVSGPGGPGARAPLRRRMAHAQSLAGNTAGLHHVGLLKAWGARGPRRGRKFKSVGVNVQICYLLATCLSKRASLFKKRERAGSGAVLSECKNAFAKQPQGVANTGEGAGAHAVTLCTGLCDAGSHTYRACNPSKEFRLLLRYKADRGQNSADGPETGRDG